ncbi:MAG: hypothetical protein IPN71_09885 [Fibrobacteres bacterium]|jgi:hypothetical protein|nr:hypothetical protein [Fibrobacterota bacterium]MBK9575804.1 hypothetical protein [Fibrobacterota bacterium]QQS04878.1 MAG: hypothetical protein IPK50_21770 [Fibrobacterota bacterium]
MNPAHVSTSIRIDSTANPFPQQWMDSDPDDIESFSVSNIESDPAYADGG